MFGRAYDYDEAAYAIVAVQADGSRRRTLARGGANDPVWSPDGRRIAFDVNPDVLFPPSSLNVMDADGTQQRRLVPERAGPAHVVGWSPDSRQILYHVSRRGRAALWTIAVDGTRKRRLVRTASDEAAWSPDGRTVAFERREGIGLLDVRKRRSKLLVRNGWSPQWMPDGRRLLFVVNRGKRSGIYLVDPDDGRRKLLRRLRANESVSLGEVSPDGRWVLVEYYPGISRVSLVDGVLQKLTSRRYDRQPEWSPNGKRVAFERSPDVWVTDADGRNKRVIARAPRLAVYVKPTWRP